jgi:hypothetical protein
MTYGFVYVLSNSSMPGIYKVGCTERPPHARAEELSRATGVARRFKVVCYGECEQCKRAEGEIHARLAGCRVSGNREFFGGELSEIITAVKSHHRLLTFCMVADDGVDPLIIRTTRPAPAQKADSISYRAPNRTLGRAAIARAKELLKGPG